MIEYLPQWGTHLISLILGLIVGSFLNVVVVRLPLGKSIVAPRSSCPSCHQVIRWYDNIPVLSYLLLRGQCRQCRAAISSRYPMIECLTALLFVAVELKVGVSSALVLRHWPLVSILLAVTFIDLEHRIIPDSLSLGGTVLGFLTSFLSLEIGWRSSLVGFLVGFGFFYLMALVYLQLRGRSGMGGGDIKLLGMIGTFIGWQGVFVTILLSSVLGSVVGLLWARWTSQKDLMKFAIPYGPFLVLGALCYYLFLSDQLWFQFMIPT